ncbi:Mo-co dimer and Cyt-b5 and Oxidored molyb domain containing protein [Trichuris trichiura]|uniref:Sulfite oxidase n=1 Tax=Trichuris trichiura TaxID=36087 RepID=A0A077YWJ7_TRITR|nr:Mo-co dimer and Cyt-b5 and Oxidored molyb domain containing protein [Trichuris trichiura]
MVLLRHGRSWILTKLVLSFGGALLVAYAYGSPENNVAANVEVSKSWKPPVRADLPTISAAEVKKHVDKETGIWVTFKGAIYDISDFCDVHPGGLIILQAAGGPLEPHWAHFTFHNSENVYEFLEELRIGNLPASDIFDYKNVDNDTGFLPVLSESLIVKSLRPLNAETAPLSLAESFYTPNSVFYKRNHHKIPVVDVHAYRLKVKNEFGKEVEFSLNELKKRFEEVTIVATLQCAGNRRADFSNVRGLSWTAGAIGNATWTGVLLSDLLRHAGVHKTENGHVVFTGLDCDGKDSGYQASIPLEKAMDPSAQVLLAYSMNGQALPTEHGFPLRVIVPGVVAARSVKWLGLICISEQECDSLWQRSDYKMTAPIPQRSTFDFAALQSIQELPVTSAICYPSNGCTFPSGTKEVKVEGYAWSGGGRHVVRVEVSSDNGKTWQSATIKNDISQPLFRRWAWVQWSAVVPLLEKKNENEYEILCKATDSSHNCQPESSSGIWNSRGFLNNSWHRVKICVESR